MFWCFAGMYASVPCMCLVLTLARERCPIPWNWGYRRLWVTMWVLQGCLWGGRHGHVHMWDSRCCVIKGIPGTWEFRTHLVETSPCWYNFELIQTSLPWKCLDAADWPQTLSKHFNSASLISTLLESENAGEENITSPLCSFTGEDVPLVHLTWQPCPKLHPRGHRCLELLFFTCFQIYLHRLQKYSYPKASPEIQVQHLGMWAKFCFKSVVNLDELRGSAVREPSALPKWGGNTSEDMAVKFAVSDP